MLSKIIKAPFAAWNQFFFREADLSIFGPIRIAYATLMLLNVLAWWPNLEKWFSDDGVMTLAVSKMVIDSDSLTLFQWLPLTTTVVWVCYAILIVALINVLLGCWTRLNLVVVFVLFTSFVHRNNLIFDGEDVMFRMMTFYLILSPAGHYLSLPHWIRRKKNSPAQVREVDLRPIWPLRLIQIQTTCILFFSGIEKLSGAQWLDGTALYYVSRLDDLFYRFPVPDFLFVSLPWIAFLTWSALVFELTVPLAVWFRPFRKYALVLVIMFHLSLDYMMNLNLFQWIMIVGWVSFIESGQKSTAKDG